MGCFAFISQTVLDAMMHYYNEHDPFAANWLRKLIAAGLIPAGDVDERSIEDVTANDVAIYTSCHWFAGIGGWPYALRLAGWPDDRPVWTGSAPCQPFSGAGQGGGFADERHLWPAWFWLIRQCQPATIFGEQVSSAAGLAWFGVVSSDLEAAGYAVGAADLCAASVGAPHIRQRLYFVAHADGHDRSTDGRKSNTRANGRHVVAGRGTVGILVDADQQQRDRRGQPRPRGRREFANSGGANVVMGNTQRERFNRQSWRRANNQPANTNAWADIEWLQCTDGKARPTQSGVCPLAHGVPGRVGLLRGYGNAIVPPLAAEFIMAYMEARR